MKLIKVQITVSIWLKSHLFDYERLLVLFICPSGASDHADPTVDAWKAARPIRVSPKHKHSPNPPSLNDLVHFLSPFTKGDLER